MRTVLADGSVVAGHSSWRSDPRMRRATLLEHTIMAATCWRGYRPAATVRAGLARSSGTGWRISPHWQVTHQNEVVGTVTTAFNGVEGREERRLKVFFEQATVEITGDFVIGELDHSFIIHRPRVAPEHPDLEKLRRELFTALGVVRDDFTPPVRGRPGIVPAVRDGLPASRLYRRGHQPTAWSKPHIARQPLAGRRQPVLLQPAEARTLSGGRTSFDLRHHCWSEVSSRFAM